MHHHWFMWTSGPPAGSVLEQESSSTWKAKQSVCRNTSTVLLPDVFSPQRGEEDFWFSAFFQSGKLEHEAWSMFLETGTVSSHVLLHFHEVGCCSRGENQTMNSTCWGNRNNLKVSELHSNKRLRRFISELYLITPRSLQLSRRETCLGFKNDVKV